MLTQLVTKVRFTLAFIRIVRNPARLDILFSLIDRINRGALPPSIAQQPEIRAFLEMPTPPLEIDLDALEQLPAGTLGHQYAIWMRAQGITPDSLERDPKDDDLGRVQLHLLRSHDIWHLVSGFDGTDIASEAGLQAFYLAQLASPVALVLLSAVFLNTVQNMANAKARMKAVTLGWDLGMRARPLFGVDWSEYWNVPLTEVREHFGTLSPASAENGERAA